MTAVAEQIGAWLEQFTNQLPAPAWLEPLRKTAFQRFAELGFPNTHNEEWRFTNVAAIARTTFAPGRKGVVQTKLAKGPIQLVFANGHLLSKPESLPKGLEVGGFADDPVAVQKHLGKYASFNENAFVALNTAMTQDGALIRVARGAVIEEPIEIFYLTTTGKDPIATHPRALILVGANAQCTIVERYTGVSEGAYLTNAVTEIVVGESAVVDHYKVQQEALSAYHVATLQAGLGRSSVFSSTSISLGGALVRNDANCILSEGSEGTLNGLYIVNGTQHVDNHTAIDHAQPHANSHELYKGILDGKSHAVFNGKIFVRKDAQKTDSKQTNKNLVLSDEAVVDTKPELQILADDVRCTHGATIGQLDAESLFYLRSRGIAKHEARNLLIFAFAQDVVDRIKVQSLRDSLEKILFEKFHEHAE
ncbi:MAG: Iron-regulated transporter permease protein SufD [Candidatus Solibacter sp.]|jgi:Fe-S cluster assembly protein SufD|nr:Iron-regulated transporter permease protein SufD [Candidatus Solibacter sp.]